MFPIYFDTTLSPDYCDDTESSSHDDVYTHEKSYSIIDANLMHTGGALAMEPSNGKLSLTNQRGG